jgi:hypothetical protein
MSIETMCEVLRENLFAYDAALASVRQCISLLETQAEDLIKEIQTSDFETSEAIRPPSRNTNCALQGVIPTQYLARPC